MQERPDLFLLLNVTRHTVLVRVEKKIIHQTKYALATNAQTCMGYVNNYDKNRYLEKLSKAAVVLNIVQRQLFSLNNNKSSEEIFITMVKQNLYNNEE